MKHLLIILSILLLSFPLFGQETCQLQTSVPPSTMREEKVDLFQFMLDMLITLWYGSNTIL